MPNLDTSFRLTPAVTNSPNLCDRFTEDDLTALGSWCHEGYLRDEQSRAHWYKRMEAAMDLALQIVQEKSFPWPGASNVKFPLVTIAALQFHARAYPSIVHSNALVKYRVATPDPTGELAARAERLGRHMSNHLLEGDTDWEEGMDRLLLSLPIVGTVFKKTYYSVAKGRPVSEIVPARDLVMDYYAKSAESCARTSHLIPLYRNDVYERCVSGVYRDVTEEPWFRAPSTYQRSVQPTDSDNRRGQDRPASDASAPFMFVEQCCLLDMDQDGYEEPYIITYEMTTRTVVRIVANWDRDLDIERNAQGRVLRINRTQYYTKYGFIPSPDGGIYDLGWGCILGPLNKSVDSLINQLIDAGTMATTAGGFLGRGVKMRGGKFTFSPLEWQKVDSSGDDLRKDIVPLPVREPSPVLFSLLSLIIEYANRIPGTTDVMVGEGVGQNTPAETVRTMVEQGTKIYNAQYKRVWRCMKAELKKLYILFGKYLPEKTSFGEGASISREDYIGNPDFIVPSADPSVVSETVRLQKALALKQAAMTTPGYNLQEVERNYLTALNVDGIERLYPGPDKVPPLPNPRMALEEKKLQAKQLQIQTDAQLFMAELMEQRKINAAKIVELHAKAARELAQADGVAAGHRIAAFEAALGAMKQHDDSLMRMIDTISKGMTNAAPTQPGGMGRLESAPNDSGLPPMGSEASAGTPV